MRYLIYIDFGIWFLPLYKQYKDGLFYYFLVTAFTPLSALSGYYFFKLFPQTIYVIMTIGLIIALQYHKDKKIWLGVLLMLLIGPLVIYFNDFKIDLFLNIILRGIILYYISYFLLDYLYKKDAINLYFIILLVGEVSTTMKMSAILDDFNIGKLFYQLTSVFEYLLCIYFIFFNIKNSPKFGRQKNNSPTIL